MYCIFKYSEVIYSLPHWKSSKLYDVSLMFLLVITINKYLKGDITFITVSFYFVVLKFLYCLYDF